MEFTIKMEQIVSVLSIEKIAKEEIGENTQVLVNETKGEDIVIYPSPILALREIFHKAEIEYADEVSVNTFGKTITIMYNDRKYILKPLEQLFYKGSGTGLIKEEKDIVLKTSPKSDFELAVQMQKELNKFPIQNLFFELDLWSGTNITSIFKDTCYYNDSSIASLQSLINKLYGDRWTYVTIVTYSIGNTVTDISLELYHDDKVERFTVMV